MASYDIMQQRLTELYVTQRIQIPMGEFEFTFARSGGPGGQNVNKVNSKAVLRWHPTTSPSLPDDIRARFLERYASRITTEGELILTSQKHRDQPSNIDDCLQKLAQMIESVAVPPKARRPTKPSLGSKIRRVESKARNSTKKAQRRAPRFDD
jgi:ribosome-associated protein